MPDKPTGSIIMNTAVGAAPALAVAWSVADLLYFSTSFVQVGMWKYGEEVRQWFAVHGILLPATALREVMLLVVVGWCVQRLRTNRHTLTPPVLWRILERVTRR